MKKDIYLYLSWLTVLVSIAGSFFFSSYMKLPPCDLCWYQRIFMFPLIIILAVGYLLKDRNIYFYSLPVILCGWVVAAYHNLLYYKLISTSLIPCTGGISCTDRQLDLLGFISIPLMSFVSFTVLLTLINLHFLKGKTHETR